MRPPPPITQFVRFPVTSGIAIMAIAVTVMAKSGRSIEGLTMTVQAFEGQPWRILTSALPHGDWLHLLFNVVWLWVFGTAIEQVWGAGRTFAIFVVLEAGSTLAEYALFSGGIGLSGIGYGLFGLLLVLAPRDARFTGAMDRRTIQLFIIWFFICIALTVTHLMAIGNVAHGVGALLGILLGFAIAGRLVAKLASGLGIAAVIAAGLAGSTLYRPLVNLSIDGGADSAELGYDLLGSGDNALAVRHLRRAVEVSPGRSSSWYNLGLGLERMGDHAAAVDAFRTAYALDPSEDQYRRALAGAIGQLGIDHAKAGELPAAIAKYRESITLDGKDPADWFNLSLAYSKSGDTVHAVEAARRAYELEKQPSNKQRLANTLDDAAEVAAQKGDDSAAVSFVREAIRVGGESADRYVLLAHSLERLGKHDDAQDATLKALELDPSRFKVEDQ